MKFEEFIDKTLGKAIDVDGVPTGQKYQCVDLPKYFNILYNGDFQILCSTSGYAKDWAINKKTNGILKYYTETTIDNMIEGTLVVYGECRIAPMSHIGFFIKDNGDGTFQMLHQNANGCHYVTISNMPYEGIIGAFIPNQLIKKEEPKEEVKKEEPKEEDKKEEPKEEVKKEEIKIDTKYINIPPSILMRNIYDNNFKQFTVIKPQKFGGLTYKVLFIRGEFARISTRDYGECYIKITNMTPITDKPLYNHGNY